MKRCQTCGKEIGKSRYKFCSAECLKESSRKGYQKLNPTTFRGTTSATTGAISELRAAVDLLSKGFNVFRALSPSCPCDLAVLKDGQLLKIEVRTAYVSTSGKLYRNINKRDNSDNIDAYAWVLPDKVVYEPELHRLLTPQGG